jgi:hypothetical protein
MGCGGASQSVNSTQAVPQEKTVYTAAEVVEAFKDANLPIGKVKAYTADTDANGLLGRPNQYTGKTNFEDTRITADDADVCESIEVFADGQDLEARKTYIESVMNYTPMVQQYLYAHKNILLRLDDALTPDQAKDYETVLNKL